MDDAWDGLFEVFKKLSDVNYEVTVPNKGNKRKIVHVNNCKEWKQGDNSVLRKVVAAEEDGDDKIEKLQLMGDDHLTVEQQRELKEVLDKS